MKPQFIVELSKLRETPCERYLKHFVDGKADALELFRLERQQYDWLYANSDYDIIGYEIEQGIFDWEKYSWAVAQCCPEYFDPIKYNWKEYSKFVAICCPEYLDVEKYNWEKDSSFISLCCPENLDPAKYNWEKDEWAVKWYCPHLLHLKPDNRNPDPGWSLSITTL